MGETVGNQCPFGRLLQTVIADRRRCGHRLTHLVVIYVYVTLVHIIDLRACETVGHQLCAHRYGVCGPIKVNLFLNSASLRRREADCAFAPSASMAKKHAKPESLSPSIRNYGDVLSEEVQAARRRDVWLNLESRR
jgi:hypothetical protein